MRDRFYSLSNRLGRKTVGAGMYVMGRLLRRRVEKTIDGYAAYQLSLAPRYDIDASTPIVTYDDSVRAAVEAYAATRPDVKFAYTSGSTNEPKKIAFPVSRLRNLVAGNVSVIARLMLRERLSSASLFILSGLKDDDSLSTLVLSDRGQQVKYLDGLMTPAKYLTDPRFAACLDKYGPCAARLWMLTLANSAIIYCTNPSTLALFLTDIHQDWAQSTAMVRDYLRSPEQFNDGVHAIRRRTAAPGWRRRFDRLADAPTPVPVADYLPGLRVYCCWDGGYVRPFLEQIEAYLPPARFRLMPMYSMSTETVETLNYFDGDDVRFLPIGPDVYYEFLPDGERDDPAKLVRPGQLVPGNTYCMVVSDCYGLRRYQTEDLFLCQGMVRGVPDLRFLRRRGIKYSFTGEKLTGEQLTEAFAALRDEFSQLRESGVQLTCVPTRPPGATTPGYNLVLAHPGRQRPAWLDSGARAEAIAAALDRIVAGINGEFAGKVTSARLAHTRAVVMPYDELAARLDAKTVDQDHAIKRTYDSQFKLLPLYSKLWQDFGFETVPAAPGG